VLLIHILVLISLFAGLANEVAGLQEKNSRVVGECTRLTAENNQLAQDHAQLLEHSRKMTEELKTKNLELISKCWLSWFCCVSSICFHMILPRPDCCSAELKVNTKKHLEEVIKDRDAYSAKTLELEKDRDL
jgi:hypothetical protein